MKCVCVCVYVPPLVYNVWGVPLGPELGRPVRGFGTRNVKLSELVTDGFLFGPLN